MAALRRYGLADAGDQLFRTLSGGQQARFQILLLELSGSTLLLLDEPTDNLDVLSAEALEEALAAFDGTVMAVTHDRWFARSFDRFLVFGADGRVYESAEPVFDETRVHAPADASDSMWSTRRRARTQVLFGASAEGAALAAVGGQGAGEHVALEGVQLVDVLADLARLGVPEPHPVADARAAPAAAPRSGVCTSPAPSVGQPAQARRDRSAPAAGRRRAGPEATQPPPATVTVPGAGTRVTGAAKNIAGRAGEGAVAVEERRAVEPRAGRHLGDRRPRRWSARGCRSRRR